MLGFVESCFWDPISDFFHYTFLGPAQNSVKYLTWHRTMSSRSYSSANPPGANSKADVDDVTNNLFDNFCMISGSHASTLDRLYAWERKLYDEVKVLYTVYFLVTFRHFFMLAMLCFDIRMLQKSWFGYQTKL